MKGWRERGKRSSDDSMTGLIIHSTISVRNRIKNNIDKFTKTLNGGRGLK